MATLVNVVRVITIGNSRVVTLVAEIMLHRLPDCNDGGVGRGSSGGDSNHENNGRCEPATEAACALAGGSAGGAGEVSEGVLTTTT